MDMAGKLSDPPAKEQAKTNLSKLVVRMAEDVQTRSVIVLDSEAFLAARSSLEERAPGSRTAAVQDRVAHPVQEPVVERSGSQLRRGRYVRVFGDTRLISHTGSDAI